jgi:hypothetical protein
VNEATHSIEAVVLTEAGGELLEDTNGPIEQVSGDGVYVKRKVKRVAIPPRRDARIWQHGNSSKPPLPRDQNLRRIRPVGRKRWKQEVAYHRRSLAETAVFRFNLIFGNTLSARSLPRQITEARINAAALNRLTRLGMPDSYPVT